MKFLVFIVIFFVIGSIATYSLSNYAHPTLTSQSTITDFKEIQEVDSFVETHGIDVFLYSLEREIIDEKTGQRSEDKFRIIFEKRYDVEIHILEVYYFAWTPFGMTYKCWDSQSEKVFIYSDAQILENIRKDC